MSRLLQTNGVAINESELKTLFNAFQNLKEFCKLSTRRLKPFPRIPMLTLVARRAYREKHRSTRRHRQTAPVVVVDVGLDELAQPVLVVVFVVVVIFDFHAGLGHCGARLTVSADIEAAVRAQQAAEEVRVGRPDRQRADRAQQCRRRPRIQAGQPDCWRLRWC